MSQLWTPLLTFLAVVVVGFLAYLPTLKREWITARDTIGREAAQRILDDRKRVFSSDTPPQPAQIQRFSFRGYAFYDRTQRVLERLDWIILGDFELDRPGRISPWFESFVRVLRSDDRQAVCSIIDATPSLNGMSRFLKLRFYLAGRHRLHLKGISLRTELNDGRFIITATETHFGPEDLPLEVLKETMRRGTPVPELVKRHRERVTTASAQARTAVVPIGTAEEFGQSQLRYQKLRLAFREKVGFSFTHDEQRAYIKGESLFQRGTAQVVLDAMRELEDDGKKRAS